MRGSTALSWLQDRGEKKEDGGELVGGVDAAGQAAARHGGAQVVVLHGVRKGLAVTADDLSDDSAE